MAEHDDLAWLMEWYVAQCNEEWEHQHGVTIDTLDNPGWSLTVDLLGTPLEQRPFEPVYENVDDEDPVQGLWGEGSWMACKVEGSKFKGYSGPRELGRLISIFREWAAQ